MSEIRAVAVHEAAHAVVARALGVACGPVTVRAEAGVSLGSATIDDPRFSWERGDGPRRLAGEAFCMALFAAAEAERALCGSSDAGDSVDRERAIACMTWMGVRGAQFVGDEQYDRYEARLRRRAAAEVECNREAIDRVAEALVERKTLTAAEVDALIQG